MFFGKPKKRNDFGYGVFDDSKYTTSFNGVVIDGVETIDDNLLLDDLCVSGSALFTGEVDADKIVIPGQAEFREFVTCDDMNIAGEATFKNELVCESIVVPGSAKMLDKVITDVLIVDGSLKANRKIKTINLNVDGTIESFDKLYADKALVKGSVIYASELRCFDVRITSEYPSTVGRIISDKLVTVSRSVEASEYVLTCDFAECGIVNIEYAKIDYLRCERCKIGRGCVIGKLECTETSEISDDAVVEHIVSVNSEVF